MQNKFSVEPVDIMPGLGLIAGAVDERKKTRGAFELDRVNQAKAQKIRQGAIDVMQSKDPEKIQAYMIKYPEASKIMESSYKFKSDATKANKIEAATAIVSGADPVQTEIDRAELVDKEGGSYQETLANIHGAMTDSEGAKKRAWVDLAELLEPKKYNQLRESLGMDKEVDDGKKGKPLKLTQLITKRNELPKGSPDIELYEKAIQKEIAAPGQAKSHPYISKLMAEGWMPSGRITGPMLSAFEAAAEQAHKMGKDLTVDDLRKMEFQAVKNRSTGSAAGSRLVLARKQGIESAQGLLKDMKVTAHKLNYSPIKFIAALEKYKKDQTGDPLFVEYMTQRADSLFILGNVLKQNGLTDKSIEVEEEAASPTLAPKAFDAWLNTQTRALNRAAKEMNTDYGYGITLLPAFDAGQAGAATAEQPTPVIPTAEGHASEISKEQYNQLPSGATYNLGGKTYRKK